MKVYWVIKKIKTGFKLLKKDPIFFTKYFKLKVLRALSISKVHKNIEGVIFEVDFSIATVMEKIYLGTYENKNIGYIKKCIKLGDIVIDVGANIGYISAQMAAIVGKTGQVHSFEPVPQYYKRLSQMANRNKGYNIVVNQYAIGNQEGEASIHISGTDNIGWNTMISGFMSKDSRNEVKNVQVKTLDNYILDKKLGRITLIKIDTEGYEYFVLKGLHDFLFRTHCRPIIICEVAPQAYSFHDYSIQDLSNYMKGFGYRVYDKNQKEIQLEHITKTTDVIFRT